MGNKQNWRSLFTIKLKACTKLSAGNDSRSVMHTGMMASHLLFLLFLHFPFETIGTDMMMYRLNHLTPSHTRWLRDFLLPYLHDLTIYMFIDSAWAVQFEQPTLFPPVSSERAHTAYMPRQHVFRRPWNGLRWSTTISNNYYGNNY